MQERFRQRKKPGAIKKKRKVTSVDTSARDDRPGKVKAASFDGSARGGEGQKRAARSKTVDEAEERSEERSAKRGADGKSADEQWRKAMTLLQYLD